MSEFKIAAAQVASVCGDIARNIRTHAATIMSAAKRGVSVRVFPERSLIGYEPERAADLAITATDERLTPLAALARQHQMTLGHGNPSVRAGDSQTATLNKLLVLHSRFGHLGVMVSREIVATAHAGRHLHAHFDLQLKRSCRLSLFGAAVSCGGSYMQVNQRRKWSR